MYAAPLMKIGGSHFLGLWMNPEVWHQEWDSDPGLTIVGYTYVTCINIKIGNSDPVCWNERKWHIHICVTFRSDLFKSAVKSESKVSRYKDNIREEYEYKV